MENRKSTVIPPKTVIFRNKAAVFGFDEDISSKAFFIEEQKPEDDETRGVYYAAAIREAADSDKLFIVMDYSETTAFLFELMLTFSKNYEYAEWNFMTFFHDDDVVCMKEKKQTNYCDLKRKLLMNMLNYGFIMKYVLPFGHILTGQDIKAIKDFWMEPEDAETFDELFTRPHEPPFPFYDSITALKRLSYGNGSRKKNLKADLSLKKVRA